VEAKLIGLGVETFKLALYLSLPMLLAGLIMGLAISIFQATTQMKRNDTIICAKDTTCSSSYHFYYALDDEYDDRVCYKGYKSNTKVCYTNSFDLYSI